MDAVVLNGDEQQRAVQYLNVSFNYVEGESLLMGIKGVAVSSGSACTSASLEPSYVLRAMGRSDELAHSSVRFSLAASPRSKTSTSRSHRSLRWWAGCAP
jgi:Cysteine sulfinate desulfinase/cysteine desulfurase and related enzymes